MPPTKSFRRFALLISLAVMLVSGVAGSTASAAEPGVVPDLTWYISEADKQKTAAALEDVGSKWVRLHVTWAEAEPSPGNYNQWWLEEYERAIRIAREAGQKVIIMVEDAPAWASGSKSLNVPENPADLAAFMGFIADRFKGTVEAYEVWNEPNLKRFWSTGPDASAYALLLKAAYPAIKAADPAAKVIFAGLSGNDYKFVEDAYKSGVKGSFDVMGTHPYPYCGSSSPEDVRINSDGRMSPDSFLAYRELRATMKARGDAKPIWFTEFGWNTSSTECDPGSGVWQGGVSEDRQARNLTKAFELIEGDPYVEVALWYNFRNNYWDNDADTPEARYGLLNTDFSTKPAYEAFKQYATGRTGSTGSGSTTETPPTSGGDDAGTPGSSAPEGAEGGGKLKPKVKLKVRRREVRGRVKNAEDGKVKLRVDKRTSRGWKRVKVYRSSVASSGRFKMRLRRLPRGAMQARVVYGGSERLQRSKSKRVRFKR